MTELPYAIRQAMVDVCAKSFWWKNELRSLFVASGVSAELWDRHRDLAKPIIARNILEHLDKRGEAGQASQQKILRELCDMRSPGQDVPDRDAAISALRQYHLNPARWR
jgi:hypothetical protein